MPLHGCMSAHLARVHEPGGFPGVMLLHLLHAENPHLSPLGHCLRLCELRHLLCLLLQHTYKIELLPNGLPLQEFQGRPIRVIEQGWSTSVRKPPFECLYAIMLCNAACSICGLPESTVGKTP